MLALVLPVHSPLSYSCTISLSSPPSLPSLVFFTLSYPLHHSCPSLPIFLSLSPSLSPFPRLSLSLPPSFLLPLLISLPSLSLSPSSQEEDTASRSDVEAHGNQYSSASSMFVFMKNSINRCTALSNGQVSTVFVRVCTCECVCLCVCVCVLICEKKSVVCVEMLCLNGNCAHHWSRLSYPLYLSLSSLLFCTVFRYTSLRLSHYLSLICPPPPRPTSPPFPHLLSPFPTPTSPPSHTLQTFLSLCKEFKTCLQQYAELLRSKCPAPVTVHSTTPFFASGLSPGYCTYCTAPVLT